MELGKPLSISLRSLADLWRIRHAAPSHWRFDRENGERASRKPDEGLPSPQGNLAK